MQATDIKALQKNENFPVARWFLPGRVNRKMSAFYQFARVADDISDNPALDEETKAKKLDEIEEWLRGNLPDIPDWLAPFKNMIDDGEIALEYPLSMLAGFKQDITKKRYKTWEELIDYCHKVVSPVGRAMLDFYGEKEADKVAADKLAYVFQIINHLQDIKDDFILRDRVYFPALWFENLDDLRADKSTESVKSAIAKTLEKTEELLIQSQSAPEKIKNMFLRVKVRYILEVASLLIRKLRENDPLAQKIRLTSFDKQKAVWRVLWKPCT